MALDDDIRDMAQLPIFQGIEPEALRLMAFSAETKILRAGDVLFSRGDASDSGYLVVSGSFLIEQGEGAEGAARIISPHSLIGEMALVTATERPATIVAHEHSTVLKITRSVFHRVLKEYPRSAVRVRKALESRLVDFTSALATNQDLSDELKA